MNANRVWIATVVVVLCGMVALSYFDKDNPLLPKVSASVGVGIDVPIMPMLRYTHKKNPETGNYDRRPEWIEYKAKIDALEGWN